MKTLLAFLAVALVAPAVFADDALVKDLERTQAKFLQSVEGLSEAQWNYKAAPEKWSIAECAEHIALSEQLIRGAITSSLETPATAEALAGAKKDETIAKFITDRSNKFKAPEPLVPSGKFASPAEALAFFKKERAETIKLAGTAADFRNHVAKHPAFGTVDAYGWFLITSGHSERHTLQIEEVKTSDGYPKN